MDKKLKVGVIGAGRIGKLHAENIVFRLNNIMELKWVADIYADKIRDWAAVIGVKNITDNYMDILNDKEIDAVLICSSTDTHARIIVEAAQHKKNIFCEKPISADVEKIEEALAAVDKAGVKLQIGFNRRFDHNFRKVQEYIKNGSIGEPHIIKITSRDPEPPPVEYVKVSGGIFMDMTIHDFDMARFLSGSEVDEVYVTGAVLVDPAIGRVGDIDTAIINLKFKNGAIGVIDNSRKAVYGYDQRIEVFGSKGCAVAANDLPTTVTLSTANAVINDKPKYFFLERYKDSFIDEVREFACAVLNNDNTPVTGIDGLKPVLIAMAAQQSLKEGRPIKVK